MSEGKGAGVTTDALNVAIDSVKEEALEGNVVLNVKVPETPKRGRGRPKKEKMEESQSEAQFKGTCRSVLVTFLYKDRNLLGLQKLVPLGSEMGEF